MLNLLNLSLIIWLIGLLLWMKNYPPANARGYRINDLGRTMFAIGIFVWLFCGCAGSRLIVNLFSR